MTTLYLVRHAEVHNPDRVLYLRQPGRYLSAEGHRQAACLARILARQPITAVYASPMPRAVQTADYIAFEHGLTLLTSPLIHEVYTPLQGWPLEAVERAGWDLYRESRPPYETWTDVLARTQQFCREVVARHPGAAIVAVTHGDVVISAALWAEGLSLTLADRAQIPYPGPASITTLIFATPDDRPQRSYTDPFLPPQGAD